MTPGHRAARAAAFAAAVLWLGVAAPASAAAGEWTGHVFEDRDGDGLRDEGEPGVPGVAIHNGRDVVLSDAEGAWSLAAEPGPFVVLSRLEGFEAETWYVEPDGSGAAIDFALRRVEDAGPADDADGTFFLHYTDAHVYPRARDFQRFSIGPQRVWVPELYRGWILLRYGQRLTEPRFTDDLAGGMRAALAPYRDVSRLWDIQLPEAFIEEFTTPGSPLGDVEGRARAAFAEMAALAPAFAVSTGDAILEGNHGSPSAVERWLRFYADLTAGLPFPVHDTIGNNEIAGNANYEFALDHPLAGKRAYQRFLGPTHYSFGAGGVHFVAFDTHSIKTKVEGERSWHFGQPTRDVRDWLRADLELHADRPIVVLNHEPFAADPTWPFEPGRLRLADDEGAFAEHGVTAVLAGHVHLNGYVERDGVPHITTGALSGFRWLLPEELYHCGYRLAYLKDGALYTAWKRVGRPVVAFVSPAGEGEHHPASAGVPASDGETLEVVAVAADTAGPFAELALERGGEPIALERWGDYFVRARVARSGDVLVLRARRADGSTVTAELDPAAAEPESPAGGDSAPEPDSPADTDSSGD